MSTMSRFVSWLCCRHPAEVSAREQVRAQTWQRKMYERTQGRGLPIGHFTQEGYQGMPVESAGTLKSVEDELDREGY